MGSPKQLHAVAVQSHQGMPSSPPTPPPTDLEAASTSALIVHSSIPGISRPSLLQRLSLGTVLWPQTLSHGLLSLGERPKSTQKPPDPRPHPSGPLLQDGLPLEITQKGWASDYVTYTRAVPFPASSSSITGHAHKSPRASLSQCVGVGGGPHRNRSFSTAQL